MLKIDYESEGFPPGPIPNGPGVLDTTWDEVLWAAITVGRPNRSYVFRHGDASRFEAIFRWSLVRMALEQGGPRAFRLRRTDAAKTLDPTEKGAVNYFLGLVFCKLFAAKLLDAPWALHLDVFGPQVRAILSGRSRPDLIAETSAGEWVSLEAKGRVSPPSSDAKNKAKDQAMRIVGVNGRIPQWHIGGITYFYGDSVRFFWRDPTPDFQQQLKGTKITFAEDAWRYHYAPVLELFKEATTDEEPTFSEKLESVQDNVDQTARPDASKRHLKEADVVVSIHPEIMRCLVQGDWRMARALALKLRQAFRELGYMPDGIMVRAGGSWREALPPAES